MKFLLQCLLVLAVAVACGAALYYAVQALPGDSSAASPPAVQPTAQNGIPTRTLPPRKQRPENGRGDGITWRSFLQVARRTIVFSVLVFISVLARNFIFERKPGRQKTPD